MDIPYVFFKDENTSNLTTPSIAVKIVYERGTNNILEIMGVMS